MKKLNELTITEAHEKLKDREISSVELTQACIDRIEAVDDSLRCFLAKDYDGALTQAKQVDKKIKKGESIHPLEGIPCSIKDIIVTKGITTTASSNMLRNYMPVFDATVIERLKSQGAVIIGKNNCDAWAHGSSTENSDFGPSHNPWNISRVPGGSSGGSAAAVAADMCLYSLGTDTGGSIRQPAAFCGVTGLKPTYGRVSRFGAIAMGSSLDTIGPITKSAEDAALVLQAIAGNDKKDSTTPAVAVPDYTMSLKEDISKLTIGIVKEGFGEGLDEEVRDSVEHAIKELESLGVKTKEISLENLKYGVATYYIIMPSEVSSNLGRYDGIRYGHSSKDANDLREVYVKSRSEGFGAEAKRRIMIGTYVLSAGYYDAYYKKAMKVRTLIKNDFEKAFGTVDALLMPTTPGTAFTIGEKVDNPLALYLDDIFTVTVNMAGLPAISIPCGFSKSKLPVGMQLIAPQFQEHTLLKLSHAYQKITNWGKEKPNL